MPLSNSLTSLATTLPLLPTPMLLEASKYTWKNADPALLLMVEVSTTEAACVEAGEVPRVVPTAKGVAVFRRTEVEVVSCPVVEEVV